jgi:regulator of protease activity HflC (stomatin/prohibitin superfamily)
MRDTFSLLIFFLIIALVIGFGNTDDARKRLISRAPIGIFLAFLTLMLLSRCWVEVPVGNVAVRFNPFAGGIQKEELAEGWHLILPWETAHPFNIRTQAYSMTGQGDEAGTTTDDAMASQTSEGLRIKVDVTVLFHIGAQGADQLWRSVGPDYINTIVRPSARNVVRLVVARYPIMEVYSNAPANVNAGNKEGILSFPGKRQEVEDKMFAELKPKLAEKGIELEKVLLRNVTYEAPDFEKSIVQKQVAQQSVMTQQYRLRIAQIQAQAQVERATGQAEAIRLRGGALRQNSAVTGLEFVQKLPDDVEVRIMPGGTIAMIPAPENRPLATPQGAPQGTQNPDQNTAP